MLFRSSAKVSGADASILQFNYAWSWEGNWGDDWSSTRLRTGDYTTETSDSFQAAKEGTYYVWVDATDGEKVLTSEMIPVTVTKAPAAWTLTGVEVADSATIGDEVTYSAKIDGDKTGLKYSYAWSWEGQWGDNWSSTKLENGGEMTTDESGTFTPTKEGTYYVWIDVDDGKGNTVTSEMIPVIVTKAPLPWTLLGVDAPDTATVGEEVIYSADIDGDTTGFTYSFAWAAGETGWDEWGSTKLENDGEMTTETEGRFTPSHAGTYRVWIDVQDADGNQVTSSEKLITVS